MLHARRPALGDIPSTPLQPPPDVCVLMQGVRSTAMMKIPHIQWSYGRCLLVIGMVASLMGTSTVEAVPPQPVAAGMPDMAARSQAAPRPLRVTPVPVLSRTLLLPPTRRGLLAGTGEGVPRQRAAIPWRRIGRGHLSAPKREIRLEAPSSPGADLSTQQPLFSASAVTVTAPLTAMLSISPSKAAITDRPSPALAPMAITSSATHSPSPSRAATTVVGHRFLIWTAAFISPPSIPFWYFGKDLLHSDALFDGDGRGFWNGQGDPPTLGDHTIGHAKQTSRIWNYVVIDDNPSRASPIVFNKSGVGQTVALWNGGQDRGYANDPDRAVVTAGSLTQAPSLRTIEVDIAASSPNPIVPASPPILYEYRLAFQYDNGKPMLLSIGGQHTQFPWHELLVECLNCHGRRVLSGSGSPWHFSPPAGSTPLDLMKLQYLWPGAQDISLQGLPTNQLPTNQPRIDTVEFSGAGSNLRIRVRGAHFGPAPEAMPSNNPTCCFYFLDRTKVWSAGQVTDGVRVSFRSWSDNEIDIDGFAGAYGTSGWLAGSHDDVVISVTNPDTGDHTRWEGRLPTNQPS